ncbi:hypothetical protein CEP53_009657 [Fusarium sp. AF-6]|nr:hypothetical protein CEP53_009657 [Fusarium sp. AF-6]
MASRNHGRLKPNWVVRDTEHRYLLHEVERIVRQIDQQFSLVQRFQQTASDLQPFRDPCDKFVVVQPIEDEYDEENMEREAMLPVWGPSPGAATRTTQLQDEIHTDKIGEHISKFPNQLVFESGQNFVLTVKETSPKPDSANADKLFQQEDGHEGLQRWLRGLRDAKDATKEVNIVVCGQATDQGAVTMKDEAVLLDVLKTLKVPLTCVHRLLDEGIPMLIEHEASPPSTGTCFTFRLPLSQNEDWTLGLHWDPSRLVVNVFIHGMQNLERLAFSRKMATALADIQHPMLLPVILCVLLTAGDIASVRGTVNQLQDVESRTRWSGVFDDAMDAEQANEGARVSFSQMTQRLNVAISRLPTPNKHCPNKEGDDTRKNEALWKSTNRLKARLQVLQATQNGLLLEIAREYQIASSQLQIVYNLVAQRDDKNNYEMARISLEISRTAKDDSFAMFTLAVMSILFLPGAFIATLFSMDLFDCCRYLHRRKEPETSSLSPGMVPDVEMNNRDAGPSGAAIGSAVLVGTETPGMRGPEQANEEAVIKRSYTLPAPGRPSRNLTKHSYGDHATSPQTEPTSSPQPKPPLLMNRQLKAQSNQPKGGWRNGSARRKSSKGGWRNGSASDSSALGSPEG